MLNDTYLASPKYDYETLRLILKKQYRREVSLEEAIRTGNCLINIYEILLRDDNSTGTI